jgi:HAD superfamily hydrolase (TIGR01509 family)
MLFTKKKLLIFDYDGTIADTASIHARAFDLTLRTKGLLYNYSDIAGLRTEDALRKIFHSNNLYLENEIKPISIIKKKFALDIMQQELKLIPGFESFINLASQNYLLSVVSSGSRASVYLGLEKFNLINTFHNIICSDDIKLSKPSPEGFLTSLESFSGVTKQDSIIFEDSNVGFEAAANAGIDFIDINNYGWLKLEQMLRGNHE